MDLHRLLLFVFASIVSLVDHVGALVEQFRRVKELVSHYVWLFLHKFLPKRRFVLERLPRHVAFSIADYRNEDGDPKVGVPDLARLVFWCAKYGVDKVSLYDWMGVIADHETKSLLIDSVRSSLIDCDDGIDGMRLVVNGVPYKAQNCCGTGKAIDSRTLQLTILDWKAGRRAIVEASRSFGVDVKSGHLEDMSKLGHALNEYLASAYEITPPDLLIEFGGGDVGDSTCGYPPLALRVVEIVKIPSHRGVDELTFLDSLEKYSQRERRFGK